MKQIIFLIIFICVGVSLTSAQENKSISLECGANMGYSANIGVAGLKYYNKISYPLSNRIGVSGCLGYFQSLSRFEKTSSSSNFSSLLTDVDVDLILFKTLKGKTLSISGGVTYFKGASTLSNVGYIYAGGVMTVTNWGVKPINNIGFNAKLRYKLPISEHLFSSINADIYCIESFTTDDLISIGYSIGYRF